jgi:hypothetical protein
MLKMREKTRSDSAARVAGMLLAALPDPSKITRGPLG